MTRWDRNPGSVGIDTQDSAGVRGHRQPPPHSTGSKPHGIPPSAPQPLSVGSTPLRAVMWITDVRDRNPRRHPSWIQNAAGSKPQHWCGIETTSSGMSLSKTCVTCDSRVVPHRSTVQAHSCLTSEFGWDPVLSARYERTMEVDIQHPRNQSGEELKPRTA